MELKYKLENMSFFCIALSISTESQNANQSLELMTKKNIIFHYYSVHSTEKGRKYIQMGFGLSQLS